MTFTAVKDAIETVNKTVSGLKTVHRDPPENIESAQVPLMTALMRDVDPISYNAAEQCRMEYHFALQIWGDAIGQGKDYRARMAKLEPFMERVRDAYAAHITLNRECDHCELTAGRITVAPYAEIPHVVLEFDLTVVLKEAVTIAA